MNPRKKSGEDISEESEDTSEDSIEEVLSKNTDWSPAELASKVFEALINLQSRINADYAEKPDDPGLILQLQTLRSCKFNLEKVFPNAVLQE